MRSEYLLLPPSWQCVCLYVCVHVGTNQVGVVFTTTEVGAKEGVGAEQGQEPSCTADQGYALVGLADVLYANLCVYLCHLPGSSGPCA